MCLYIDENLTWRVHTTSVLQRVLSRVHCFYHLNPIPNDLLGKLYRVFVLPILDYCDAVWTPSSTIHFKLLERLHIKFSNLWSTAYNSMSIALTERQCYLTAIQVFRTLHKISPSYVHNTFYYTVDITSRVACNAHHLFVPRVRTTLAKNSYYYRGTQFGIH